jgi:hypothetical protein
MADLFDRIYGGNPENETPELSTHLLTAALTLVQIGQFTTTQVKTYFNMDAAAGNDFDALATALDQASTKADKMELLWRLEAAGIATEHGIYTTKTAYRSALGI